MVDFTMPVYLTAGQMRGIDHLDLPQNILLSRSGVVPRCRRLAQPAQGCEHTVGIRIQLPDLHKKPCHSHAHLLVSQIYGTRCLSVSYSANEILRVTKLTCPRHVD